MNQTATHLLLVEPNPFLANVLHQTFIPDFSLKVVTNGVDALDWLRQHENISLIISEFRTPVVDGEELIALVRHNNLLGHLPILMLFGSEDSQTRIRCLELGADAYVSKPFNPLEVKAKVGALLRRVRFSAPTLTTTQARPFVN